MGASRTRFALTLSKLVIRDLPYIIGASTTFKLVKPCHFNFRYYLINGLGSAVIPLKHSATTYNSSTVEVSRCNPQLDEKSISTDNARIELEESGTSDTQRLLIATRDRASIVLEICKYQIRIPNSVEQNHDRYMLEKLFPMTF